MHEKESSLEAELASKDAAAAAERLLLSALAAGAPQSFCELSLLQRRPRLHRDDPGESPEAIAAVRDALTAGERLRHAGDARAAAASFASVGRLYAGGAQHRLAAFFHTRALELAREAGDAASQAAELHCLGLSCEALGEYADAVEHHAARLLLCEASLSASEAAGEGAGVAEARAALGASAAALMRVYGVQARIAEAQAAPAESLRLYSLALRAARQSGEAAAEARANYDVGRASVIAGDGRQALPYLEAYLQLSQTEPALRGNVSQALAALAAAHQAVGNAEASSESLQRLLAVAAESGDAAAEAEASEQIGIALAQQGRRAEAEPHLARAFELRRTMVAGGGGARAPLDKVRILLGMVRGDARLEPLFASIARVDVGRLLSWRLQHSEIS